MLQRREIASDTWHRGNAYGGPGAWRPPKVKDKARGKKGIRRKLKALGQAGPLDLEGVLASTERDWRRRAKVHIPPLDGEPVL
ncbi:unnamed protein product, partial [Chrysoparadoxa australica]